MTITNEPSTELKTGRVVTIAGPVVDVEFPPNALPEINTALAMTNTAWLELLYPLEDFAFGLATPLDIRDGYAYAPAAPGLGAAYDWDAIDDATVEII